MSKHKKTREAGQRELLGKKVLCIGIGGAIYQCQNCLRIKKKGMFLEYNSKLFCSEECIEYSKVGTQ